MHVPTRCKDLDLADSDAIQRVNVRGTLWSTSRLAALAPLGRLGRPDDVAGVVSSLVELTERWVNGQLVYANGGVV